MQGRPVCAVLVALGDIGVSRAMDAVATKVLQQARLAASATPLKRNFFADRPLWAEPVAGPKVARGGKRSLGKFQTIVRLESNNGRPATVLSDLALHTCATKVGQFWTWHGDTGGRHINRSTPGKAPLG